MGTCALCKHGYPDYYSCQCEFNLEQIASSNLRQDKEIINLAGTFIGPIGTKSR